MTVSTHTESTSGTLDYVRKTTRIKRTYKKARRWLRALRRPRNRRKITVGVVVIALAAVAIIPTMSNDTIGPAAYQPLLTAIAKGESQDNYNAYFGHAANSDIKFTDMTIGEVLAWQDSFVEQGAPSNAVGKYQIIASTLRGLVVQLGLNANDTFNAPMQDRLAMALIDRRGAKDFVKEQISIEQFATNLAQEWAALPALQGPNIGRSYYDGDGLNAARVTDQEIRSAIANFGEQARTL